MLDRTNIGISPLLSTPISNSYVAPVQAPVTYETVPQTTYLQEAYPTSTYGAQAIDTGITIPQTTEYTTGTYTQEALTSFVPQITTPDQALTTYVPDTTNLATTIPSTQTYQTLSATPQASTTTSVVPNVVLPPQPPTPSASPIMDEDFQRGRPIYDEFREDRYRGFRFGN